MVLASISLRRRELITAFKQPVTIVAPGYEESPVRRNEDPGVYTIRQAEAKTKKVASRLKNAIILAADTVITIDNIVLGKPDTAVEAISMLTRLRGRRHKVTTGITVTESGTDQCVSTADHTDVLMRNYSDHEILEYVKSGESYDKAGSYAIQDTTFRPAKVLKGCYLNVVGLPVCKVVSALKQFQFDTQLKDEWYPPIECRHCPLLESAKRQTA